MSRVGPVRDRRAGDASPGRRWPMLVALIVMWIALWGTLSIANILGGALVALAVLVFAGRVKPRPVHNLHPDAALRYLRTFAMQLVVANWQVIKAVLRPGTIKPGILAMPLHHASDAVVTLVANSITLTPGTLTLETERRDDVAVLYVHALDLTDADGVREDICELEVLAVDAFAGSDAQAVQARTLEELEEGVRPSADGEHPDDEGDGAQ
jgi:multicomponent Na+:H+ antiporter subunit E